MRSKLTKNLPRNPNAKRKEWLKSSLGRLIPQGKRLIFLEAGDKTRTCDRLITNQLLYQLSYTSKQFS
jgi:hypothetical protein